MAKLTVKELRDMIRKHREEECPKISKMKKSDLMAYAKQKGLIHEEAPKPKAKEPSDAHFNVKKQVEVIRKKAQEWIKENPNADVDSIRIPNPPSSSDKHVEFAEEVMETIFKMTGRKNISEEEQHLQRVMYEFAKYIFAGYKQVNDIQKRKLESKMSVDDIQAKIRTLQQKLDKVKSKEEQFEILDQIDDLKHSLKGKRA